MPYWNMINRIQADDFLEWALDSASKMVDEYPDKQDYAEILANLVMMQSGDLIEQVQNQSLYDAEKGNLDYAMDLVDIASSFLGGTHLLEEVSPILESATGGADVILDTVAQAKYYETSIRDYAQSALFLEAVSRYAENKELREVAASLLDANNRLLKSRLEYLTDVSATLADYEGEFFLNNLSFALLKTSDLYLSDETVRWYVDCGETLSSSIGSLISSGSFAFKMTMLAGDIGFGTSDTFHRYQEMNTIADIAGALVEANRRVQTPSSFNSPDALSDIRTKCDYYKLLIVTHARGEYLVYHLLMEDGGLLSDFRALFDAFKSSEGTTESWYNRQLEVLLRYYDLVNGMFPVQIEVGTSSAPSVESTPPREEATDSILTKYQTAVAQTTTTGSWNETFIMEADMTIRSGSSQTRTKMTLNSTSKITDYRKDDLSGIRISGTSTMKLMGQEYAWTTDYHDGIAHYDYTAPTQQSMELEIDPAFFNFDVITQDAVTSEKIQGNQIHFVVAGDKLPASTFSVLRQINGMEDLQYNDITVDVTLRDTGTVEKVIMNFDASLVYQGYDADVTYLLQYEFF